MRLERSQEKIRQDVFDELSWDERVDPRDLDVEVSDGTVTLRGTVPSFYVHDAAIADASFVPGVRNVRDEIAVVYPTTTSPPDDDELTANARSVLGWSPDIQSGTVEVSVQEGIACLRGEVPTFWQKRRAEDLMMGLAGVVRVDNQIEVVPAQAAADEVTAEAVRRALQRNTIVDESRLDVRVNNGLVELSGLVPSLAARRAAQESAYYVAGVRDVDASELRVL